MIKLLKSNKILSFLVLTFLLIFILNPDRYMQTCLSGLSVWCLKVLPALFPFLIGTRVLLFLNTNSLSILDKPCYKLFKTKNSGKIFFLSMISGYPIGAKLICEAYKSNSIQKNHAKKMLSFCSVSGPMFIIGSVGLGIFKSVKLGYLMLLSHILSAIINGIIFKNCYKEKEILLEPKNVYQTSKNILGDSVYDSLISILLVAGYIVLSFVLIELLNAIKIIPFIAYFVGKISLFSNINLNINFINGILEMTRGLVDISKLNLSLKQVLPIANFLISFGGVSVFLQSLTFTKELNVKKSFYLFQKFTQGIISAILGICLSVFI